MDFKDISKTADDISKRFGRGLRLIVQMWGKL